MSEKQSAAVSGGRELLVRLISGTATAPMAEQLTVAVGAGQMQRLYDILEFLWEVEMYDVACELVTFMHELAGRHLPRAVQLLMADEESASAYIDEVLAELRECAEGATKSRESA